MEMARTSADYDRAIFEFEKAKTLAPYWAEVYYNLSILQEKTEKYDDAIKNLKQYLLLLDSSSSDAAAAKSLINKLEYKRERAEEKSIILSGLIGEWVGEQGPNNMKGWPGKIFKQGDLLYFYAPMTHVIGTMDFIDYEKVPVKREGTSIRFRMKWKIYCSASRRYISSGETDYHLELMGNELKGTRNEGLDKAYFLKK